MAETKLNVQVKLPKELMREIHHLALDWNCSKAAAIERLLREGLVIGYQKQDQ